MLTRLGKSGSSVLERLARGREQAVEVANPSSGLPDCASERCCLPELGRQIIISLLYLQANKTRDPGFSEALMESQTRVRSMALVHEKLYQSDNLSSIDFEGYLKNLVANLMDSYGVDRSRVKVTIAVSNLPMTINTAIPLGLIMNELVSNALKYAFPPGNRGEVSISGSVEGDILHLTPGQQAFPD